MTFAVLSPKNDISGLQTNSLASEERPKEWGMQNAKYQRDQTLQLQLDRMSDELANKVSLISQMEEDYDKNQKLLKSKIRELSQDKSSKDERLVSEKLRYEQDIKVFKQTEENLQKELDSTKAILREKNKDVMKLSTNFDRASADKKMLEEMVMVKDNELRKKEEELKTQKEQWEVKQ